MKVLQTPQPGIPQLGEHKGDEHLQTAFDGAFLSVSPLSFNKGVTGSNRDFSLHKSPQQQIQIRETSVAIVRSSVGGTTPDGSLGRNSGDREDSSFIPKAPPSSPNAQP